MVLESSVDITGRMLRVVLVREKNKRRWKTWDINTGTDTHVELEGQFIAWRMTEESVHDWITRRRLCKARPPHRESPPPRTARWGANSTMFLYSRTRTSIVTTVTVKTICTISRRLGSTISINKYYGASELSWHRHTRLSWRGEHVTTGVPFRHHLRRLSFTYTEAFTFELVFAISGIREWNVSVYPGREPREYINRDVATV